MKTIKLKILFSVLISTGLLFACSSDDDSMVADDPVTPNPRTFSGPPTTPIDLSFSATLDTFSEEDGCGEDIYLFSHSGQGSNDLTGEFTVDMSYCGQPRSFAIYDLQVTLENTAGDKLFLRQRTNPDVRDPAGEITNANAEANGGEITSLGDANEPGAILEDGILVMEVVGGTGEFAAVQGELSSRISPAFSAGAESANFVFSGFVIGL